MVYCDMKLQGYTQEPAQRAPLWGTAQQLGDALASLAYQTLPHPVSSTERYVILTSVLQSILGIP